MYTQKKYRIGKLDTAGSIASENRKIYALLRRGRIDGPLASRLSAILVAQKGILESSETENRLAKMEGRLVDLLNQMPGNIVKFQRKAGGPFDG